MIVGDALLNIVRQAVHELLIVAPYIKAHTLKRLLEEVPSSLGAFTCLTRWLPEDIAAGVCDLEIFDLLEPRPNARLLVHPHLHAKYYRADGTCLVGSANVTHRALGWTTPPNLELIVEVPAEFEGLLAWERRLTTAAVPATAELRDQIAAAAVKIRESAPIPLRLAEVGSDENNENSAALWLPTCPVPERLWSVYIGQGEGTMVTSARDAARADLAALSPPSGLGRQLFTVYLVGILRQMPLIEELDCLVSNGLSDTQAYTFLADRLGGDHPFPVEQVWRVLKSWLIHFFPESYRLEVGQEVLVKGKRLASPR